MNSEKALEVTASELEAFCNEAFRNIDMPPLDRADMADVKDALYALLKRQPLAKPSPAPVEREKISRYELALSTIAKGKMVIDQPWDAETARAIASECLQDAAALAPEPVREGQCAAPLVPTEAMWGGLARDLMMWLDFGPGERTPRALFRHLERCGRDIPQWLRDEPEMKALDHSPSKGTRAVLIYRAMLEPLSAREGE